MCLFVYFSIINMFEINFVCVLAEVTLRIHTSKLLVANISIISFSHFLSAPTEFADAECVFYIKRTPHTHTQLDQTLWLYFWSLK